MSLEASLATINYFFFKNLNKNLVSGLPLPIVPWHFFATLPSVFLTLLDEFGVTQHPSLLLQGYWTSS